MAMEEDAFGEWDADFLDQLLHVEELALSSTQPPPPPKPPAPASTAFRYFPPPQAPPQPPSFNENISYSPPRELSQRVTESNCNNNSSNRFVKSVDEREIQIENLKRELGRMSKQLTSLEQECSELRTQRDEKEQIKSAFCRHEARDTEHNLRQNSTLNSGVLVQNQPGISPSCQNANVASGNSCSRVDIVARKTIGIQTDSVGESINSSTDVGPSPSSDLHNRLLSIWSFSGSQSSRNDFVAKLFEKCMADFCVLFGCLGSNMSSKMMDPLEISCPTYVTSAGSINGPGSAAGARITQLYSVLTQLRNNMIQIDAVLEVLLGLCGLDNCTLLRDNVKIEGRPFGKDTTEIKNELRDYSEYWDQDSALLVQHIDWDHLFEAMRQITTKFTDGNVRVEAASIMNLIVMRSNAYHEREKFGGTAVLQAVAQMLRREVGVSLQKEAVHLLYLLLNCPKLLATFCLVLKDGETSQGTSSEGEKGSDLQLYGVILDGLEECIASTGNGAKGINLRRNVIVVLAFLTSSGKSGLEILLFHKLPGRANFLALILQALVSEIDAEAAESFSPSEVSKERTLLMREALILLNRLASHSEYSITVLQVLTSCRDSMSFAIDIATRMSKKTGRLGRRDTITRHMRESEIVDLARLFRKRIYAFLGESSST